MKDVEGTHMGWLKNSNNPDMNAFAIWKNGRLLGYIPLTVDTMKDMRAKLDEYIQSKEQ